MIEKFLKQFVTLFGIGNISNFPGTLASLVTSLFFYLILIFTEIKQNWYIKDNLIIIYILFVFFSYLAIEKTNFLFKQKDAKEIVIDEVCGQALPFITIITFITIVPEFNRSEIAKYKLALANFNVHLYSFASFVLFRFFDILKPFPINYIDKKFKNSFGILFDDIVAGLISSLLILIPLYFAFN